MFSVECTCMPSNDQLESIAFASKPQQMKSPCCVNVCMGRDIHMGACIAPKISMLPLLVQTLMHHVAGLYPIGEPWVRAFPKGTTYPPLRNHELAQIVRHGKQQSRRFCANCHQQQILKFFSSWSHNFYILVSFVV